MLNLSINTHGPDRDKLVDASLKGLNLVYWVLVVLTLPPTIFQHIFLEYVTASWVFVGGPLIYVPAALGWFPRRPEYRVLLGSCLLLAAALAINAVQGWYAQPGLYVTLPPCLALFAVYGLRGLIGFGTATVALVAATSLAAGHNPLDVAISLTLWLAVAVAACSMLRFVIDAAFIRNEELRTASEDHLARQRAQLAAHESLNKMYASLVHELRAPASAIAMLSDSPRLRDSNPGLIGDESRRLLQVLDDLGNLIAPERQISSSRMAATFDDLFQELRRSVDEAMAISGCEFFVDSDLDAHIRYMFDLSGLRALLALLIRDRCIGAGGRGIRLHAELSSQEQQGIAVALCLSTDRWESEEALPGPRNESAVEIASAWTELMGGQLLDHSTAERVEYRLVLPVTPLQQSEVQIARSDTEVRNWLKGRAVLIVEDDPMMAKILRDLLEKHYQARVLTAKDGVDAMGILASNRLVDLLIADHFMPRLSGAELACRLRASGNGVPIIGVTAGMLAQVDEKLSAAGVNKVLRKPVTPEKLEIALSEILAEMASVH